MTGIKVETLGDVLVEFFQDEATVQLSDMPRANFDELYDGICFELGHQSLSIREDGAMIIFSKRQDA